MKLRAWFTLRCLRRSAIDISGLSDRKKVDSALGDGPGDSCRRRPMLSDQDNAIATNTNRGSPMGELFRRFWLPVALADELPGPDCVPLRVKVMGEDLIAFR